MAHSPFTRRLEELRKDLGVGTVQEFVDLVNSGLNDPVPYATARRYHRDREPPVTYLRDVARRFRVSLPWLLLGEGRMFQTVDAEAAGIAEVSQPRARDWRLEYGTFLKHTVVRALDLPESDFAGDEVPAWVAPLAEAWARVGVPSPREADPATREEDDGVSRGNNAVEPAHEKQFRVLGSILRGPFDALGIDAEAIDEGVLTHYVLAMATALLTLASAQRRASTSVVLEELARSLRDPEAVRALTEPDEEEEAPTSTEAEPEKGRS